MSDLDPDAPEVRVLKQTFRGDGMVWVAKMQHPAFADSNWEKFRTVAAYLNELEATKHRLEAELQEEKKLRISLQEDVRQFNTFEQICNSGMLRNFKIDPEGDFGLTILSLLQRTMELQIQHLGKTVDRKKVA
jgi:hypothetical protein